MEPFSNAFGSYTLQRLPIVKNDTLRAWDAADELLLNTLHEQGILSADSKVLLINDQFGALSISLNEHAPTNWSDSYQSHLSVTHNLTLNGLEAKVDCIPSTHVPTGSFDVVLIKVPKTMALLEDQLTKVKVCISAETKVIAAGMVKHIHTSTLSLFEKVLGTTTTSLAKKKARLIYPTFEKAEASKSPYPKSFYDEGFNINLSNHANVFAKDKLDMGARFMLEQFKQLPPSKHILDLGCGNGVLGIIAKQLQTKAQATFVDESYMAIASAKDNYQAIIDDDQADFLLSDSLSTLINDNEGSTEDNDDVDLIVCNPPFHQQHAVGDHIAWQMFKQSLDYLKSGGVLWVVSNRHLGNHAKLKKLFGNCRTIANNKKFVVLAAKKR